MKIFKYHLGITDEQIINMPGKASILDIQMQNGRPAMWVICNPDSDYVDVKINMYATGHPIERGEDHYLGTIQDGTFVFHYFMQVD